MVHGQLSQLHVDSRHAAGRTLSENQEMKPNLLRWLAMAMSAANQDSVSQDAPCARFSFLQCAAELSGVQLGMFLHPVQFPAVPVAIIALRHNAHHSTTPVMSRMARPSSAAATALTPMAAPKIHRPTVIAKANAVIFSSVDSGPGGLADMQSAPASQAASWLL
jgi:hypothetical protein